MTVEEENINKAAQEHRNNPNPTIAFISGAKSPEAKEFHTKGMYGWDEINMMLSAFICEYCPETSSKFSPGMFINKYFEQNKKK